MAIIQHKAFASSRQVIEAEIERLIDLLDLVDGDADLEPEQDCCTDDLGEHDIQVSPIAPIYGLDQSTAPMNMREMASAQYDAEKRLQEVTRAGMAEPAQILSFGQARVLRDLPRHLRAEGL